MKNEIVLVCGYPASGKSTLTKSYVEKGYVRLNRDEDGGTLDDLNKKLKETIKTQNFVVMDNLYATIESRKGPIEIAKAAGFTVSCMHLKTSMEDAQFNACVRMVEKHGHVLEPKEKTKDPNSFPVAVIYKYKKDFQKPTKAEGFDAIYESDFIRKYPGTWVNKAIVLDYDGTLRETISGDNYPVDPSDIRILPNRTKILKEYQKQGYILCGVSNQSGIAKGLLTAEMAKKCFDRTNEMLGLDIDVRWCPHKIPPITCYCRKPGCSLGVELIMKYKLLPPNCIFVGDLGTDKSFAGRCGFQFREADDFFKE